MINSTKKEQKKIINKITGVAISTMIKIFFTKTLSMLSSQFVMIIDAGKNSNKILLV